MIYLTAISIALFGCVKGPIAELEEKGSCAEMNGCFYVMVRIWIMMG